MSVSPHPDFPPDVVDDTSADTFVRVWNNAGSPAEVAEHYIMSVQAVCNKASRLRARGHVLKSFRPSAAEQALWIASRIELEECDLALALKLGRGSVSDGIRKALRTCAALVEKQKTKPKGAAT
jgi:hypothetical protein